MDNQQIFASDDNESIDKHLRAFFPDYSYKGIFIDVGAFHSKWLSNSYHFEVNGWNVICIEPNPYCLNELNQNRKCVIPYAAYSKNIDNMEFCIDSNSPDFISHMAGGTTLKKFWKRSSLKEVIKVNARTLDWILESQNITKIDILSIDVEGGEIEVLKGTNLKKWNPKIIVIENLVKRGQPRPMNQNDYLLKHGYNFIKRIHPNDFYERQND